jgi:hypothetical protein
MHDPPDDEPQVAQAEQGDVERPRQGGLRRSGDNRRRRARQCPRNQFRRLSSERHHLAGEPGLLEPSYRRRQRSTIHIEKSMIDYLYLRDLDDHPPTHLLATIDLAIFEGSPNLLPAERVASLESDGLTPAICTICSCVASGGVRAGSSTFARRSGGRRL